MNCEVSYLNEIIFGKYRSSDSISQWTFCRAEQCSIEDGHDYHQGRSMKSPINYSERMKEESFRISQERICSKANLDRKR